jgi:3-phosphoshikimate 1-carboxyvinyltransferase
MVSEVEILMQFLDLAPVKKVQGNVVLPGSKSISNRTLLLAALCQGTTEIKNLLESDDTKVMLDALKMLGVNWQRHDDTNDYRVEGIGGPFKVKQAELFMGNAGTAIRPLCAALALSGGDYKLSGVPRMHERPIADLVDGLRQIGAQIDYLGNAGFPPLQIKPAAIRRQENIKVRGDVSSQFLTALLMALPLAKQNATIAVVGELISKPYVEITLNLMRRFGVTVGRNGWESFSIAADQHYRSPTDISVEGDASSASYFLAAGAIAGGPVRVTGVGKNSIQGDVRFADALEQMGAQVVWGDDWIEVSSKGKLKAIDADFNHIPDAAMTIAVAALFADGTTSLRNIGSWRVKETDRIFAVATELRKLGATVEEGADFLRITPPSKIVPAAIDTYDDHRMAMAFSLASLGDVSIRINDPHCVNKTFPEYFSVFDEIKY